MQSRIELCLSLASEAHAGQVDKGGAPYIEHPMRVALRCDTELRRCAALLHDVLEDTDATEADLIAAGVGSEVVRVVKALTHGRGLRYDEYMAYIREVAEDPDARAVKMADLRDNMDLSRIHGRITFADKLRQGKYEDAYTVLEAAR